MCWKYGKADGSSGTMLAVLTNRVPRIRRKPALRRAGQSPTSATAFSRNNDLSLMYRRTIFPERWPVCFMTLFSERPAATADVASPDLKL